MLRHQSQNGNHHLHAIIQGSCSVNESLYTPPRVPSTNHYTHLLWIRHLHSCTKGACTACKKRHMHILHKRACIAAQMARMHSLHKRHACTACKKRHAHPAQKAHAQLHKRRSCACTACSKSALAQLHKKTRAHPAQKARAQRPLLSVIVHLQHSASCAGR